MATQNAVPMHRGHRIERERFQMTRLSPRQRQIAEMIADDIETPEIARRLGIGIGSVRTQIVRMKAKRGWHTRLDIAKYVWNKRSQSSRIYKGIQAAT